MVILSGIVFMEENNTANWFGNGHGNGNGNGNGNGWGNTGGGPGNHGRVLQKCGAKNALLKY